MRGSVFHPELVSPGGREGSRVEPTPCRAPREAPLLCDQGWTYGSGQEGTR